MSIIEKIKAATDVALRIREDGSLTTAKIERYALVLCEGVLSDTASWALIYAPGAKAGGPNKLPSSSYKKNVCAHPAFKSRLETLMAEKAALEGEGIWGQLQWQATQIYRHGAALNDTGLMTKGTELLLKVALKSAKTEDPPTTPGRGPGAPPTEAPSDPKADVVRARLLGIDAEAEA